MLYPFSFCFFSVSWKDIDLTSCCIVPCGHTNNKESKRREKKACLVIVLKIIFYF